ncbi:hypothetical protein PR048_021041 [Dryococelus australis]|uniref:Uncharacterized protein n=1 Tax=Dryococelus australis TaxID=614101 RepID=A0ABQ9GX52_9NEOP|nr:hypothetical protein PR048_021041 [Dryococelus australis]
MRKEVMGILEGYHELLRKISFKVGDLVLVEAHSLSSNLAPKWVGPYKMSSFLTPVTLLLEDLQDHKRLI